MSSSRLTSIPLISKILAFSCKDIKSAVRYSYTCSSWREVVEHYNLQVLRTVIPESCSSTSSKSAAPALWSLIRVAAASNLPWLVVSLLQVFDYIHGIQKCLVWNTSIVSDAVGPLVAACSRGNVEVVKVFFEFKDIADVFRTVIDTRDVVGNFPLKAVMSFASENTDREQKQTNIRAIRDEIMMILLKNGASLSNMRIAQPSDCPLFVAAAGATSFDDPDCVDFCEKNLELLRSLLVDAPRAVNHADALRIERSGVTVLMHAAASGAVEGVRFLLEELPRLAPNKVPKLDSKDSEQRTVFWHLLNGSGDNKNFKRRTVEILRILIRAHRRFVGDDAPIIFEGLSKGWKGFTWNSQLRVISQQQNEATNTNSIAKFFTSSSSSSRTSLNNNNIRHFNDDTLLRTKNLVSSIVEKILELIDEAENEGTSSKIQFWNQVLQESVNEVHPSCLQDLNPDGVSPFLYIIKEFTGCFRQTSSTTAKGNSNNYFSLSKIHDHRSVSWKIEIMNIILRKLISSSSSPGCSFPLRSYVPYCYFEEIDAVAQRKNFRERSSSSSSSAAAEWFKNDSCCGFTIFHLLCFWKRTHHKLTDAMFRSVLQTLSNRYEELLKNENFAGAEELLSEFRICFFEQRCMTGQNLTAFEYLMLNGSDEEKHMKSLDESRNIPNGVLTVATVKLFQDNFLEKVKARYEMIVNILLENVMMTHLVNSEQHREFIVGCINKALDEFEKSRTNGIMSFYSKTVVDEINLIQVECLAKMRALG